MSGPIAAAGKVVSIHYTLRNDAGDVLDSSGGGAPLEYLHGAGNIIPGLEDAIEGKGQGENVKVSVKPEDAYGERRGPGPQAVPRAAFPPGVQVAAGMQFAVEGPDGQPVPVWVVNVTETQVFIDVNHPLAGETLHFDVDVQGVRDATAEELSHGHPHGPGGHNH